MPAYNFSAQFAGKVVRGEKRQTIRALRKDGREERVGQTAFCFFGMRTKHCRRLIEGPIVSVDRIVLDVRRNRLKACVAGRALREAELEQLALADGFDSSLHLAEFFGRRYGFPFTGRLIVWDPKP